LCEINLKPLAKDAIPNALERAIHYRFLNEPGQAISICLDILDADSNNQDAIKTLILARTDKFGTTQHAGLAELKKLIDKLDSEYEQYYYSGLVSERLAKSVLNRTTPRVKYIAWGHIQEALVHYQKAESRAHDDENEETTLRWNACVRMINEFHLEPAPDSEPERPFME
jgi:tetratricopeptide (TPR) repeat protein